MARHCYTCSKNICFVASRSTLSIAMELLLLRLNFVLLEFPFVKNWTASKKLQSPAGYEIVLLKSRENVWSCICCFPPWPACLFTTMLDGIKLCDEDSRQLGYEHNLCQNAVSISTLISLYFLKTVTCLSVGSIADRSTIFCVLYDCVTVDYDKLLCCANVY
jgi:hypothetical protein